jgi:hypothetical protein
MEEINDISEYIANEIAKDIYYYHQRENFYLN